MNLEQFVFGSTREQYGIYLIIVSNLICLGTVGTQNSTFHYSNAHNMRKPISIYYHLSLVYFIPHHILVH
jgi:hypothetical protein